jgi:branched-chain amino acid transport system ATP-binding protein
VTATLPPQVLDDADLPPAVAGELDEPYALADSPGGGPVKQFFQSLKGFSDLRKTPYGAKPVLVFAFVDLFETFDSKAFAIAAPFMVRELGLRVQSIIDIATFIGVFAVLFAIGAGWWLDRHKRVPVYAVGTATAGLFSMFTGRAKSTLSMGVPRVADDVSNVVANVPSFALLADYYPPETRGRAFAFLSTFRRLGTIASVAFVGLMLDNLGIKTTFYLVGLPILVMGIVAGLVLREPVRGYFERRAVGQTDAEARIEDEAQSFGEGWRTTFAVRTVRRIFIGEMFIGFVDSFLILLPFYFVDDYHLSATKLSLITLPSVVVAIIAGIYGGGLVDRFTTKNPGRVLSVYGIFTSVSALAFLGYALKPPLAFIILAQCIGAFGLALTGPATGAVFAQVIPPQIRTQGLQLMALSSLPGLIFGLQIAGRLHFSHGYTAIWWLAIPVVLVAAALYASAGAYFDIDRRNAFAQASAAEDWRKSKESGNSKLLVCRDVEVAYDGVQVLFGIDFDVEDGDIIALLGTNGAGKSTLLRAISGTQEASGGAIVFDGRDITHMPPAEVAGRGVVQMPGGKGVFPGLTVRENLILGNWLGKDDDPAELKARVAEVFDIFPILRERADEAAGALSGGEQQMLSLAQAFLMRPRLLMIDELSLGLSPAVVGQLVEIVKELNRRGIAVIVVEQSVNVALSIAEKAIFMEKGEVKFSGPTAQLLERPDILRAVYVKGSGSLTSSGGQAAKRSERDQRQLDLTGAPTVLEAIEIEKRFGGIQALDGVSLELREGEVLGIIGPNGSGKTTLFDVLSGFQPADGGRVVYNGVDITRLSPEARASQGLVRRFQDARLFPSLTVFETLLVALEGRLEVHSTFLNAVAAPQARRAERRLRARAEKLIELLGLEAYRDKFVKELSTGLRRIVDLACVLAAEPKVLLLDEPSSGIAQAEAESLGPLLRRVRFETGCSILIIEHDMPLISAVSDELIAMERGSVLTRGRPDEVLNNERVIESYLGGSEAAVKRSGSLT